MNIKQLQIDALNNQISALRRANEMMRGGWANYTNESAFKFCDMEFAKKFSGKDYVCPFSAPVNGMLKPALSELYIAMNEDMIKELERKLKEIKYEQFSS